MSSKGLFPSLVVPTWHGFIGPKKKTASGTTATVTPAAPAGGTTFGPVTPLSLAFSTNIYSIHALLVPDPGSNVGSVSPSSVAGHAIDAVVNLKIGSPINGYIIFAGSYSVPSGATVTYTDNTSVLRTETPVLTDLSAFIGAGFSSWKLAHLIGGTSSTSPFTLVFNGV